MRIGFAGAHRTGKTTLARQVAKVFQLPLIESPAGKIAADFGFNMATDNRLQSGMAMQNMQLAQILGSLDGQDRFVTDRTPIDAAAYLLADATASAGSENNRRDAVIYMESAIQATRLLFDVVILVPPGIPFDAVEGKPPINDAYQEHIHTLVRGMLFDDDLADMQQRIGSIERSNTDRLNRMTAALDFIADHFPEHRSAAA